MIDWKIRSRSNECQACNVKFTDGQAYHTLLFSERKEHQRVDVCRDCWDGQYGHGANDRKGFISHWSGKFLIPPPPPPEPIQKETADTALKKLVELEDQSYGSVCFILAAMLERKRLLKVREEFRDGDQRGFVYEHSKTGDIFTIRDPELKLDELQEVQHDVALLLEKGVDVFLNGPEADESSENESSEEDSSDSDEPTEVDGIESGQSLVDAPVEETPEPVKS
jgi:hypothetical protein